MGAALLSETSSGAERKGIGLRSAASKFMSWLGVEREEEVAQKTEDTANVAAHEPRVAAPAIPILPLAMVEPALGLSDLTAPPDPSTAPLPLLSAHMTAEMYAATAAPLLNAIVSLLEHRGMLSRRELDTAMQDVGRKEGV